MKFLLTSNGICNQTLADVLSELVGKPASETKIGFIPTAVDGEKSSNKDWFIKQLTDLQKFGFSWIDIVDIAAENVNWQEKLDKVDVVYVGGGNEYYLIGAMRKGGFKDWLEQRLDKKVYVGGSAGSVAVTPSITVSRIESYGSPNVSEVTDMNGLGFVDFEFGPHIPDWPSYEEAEDYAKTTKNRFYVVDNESAIKVVDGEIEIVGEGKHRQYN